MGKFRFMLLLLGLGIPAFAAEDPEIAASPPMGWRFKIAQYLNIAVSLQQDGKEKAVQRLQSWADSGKHEAGVIILCRMLFEPKKWRAFRRPSVGEPILLGKTDYLDWPLEPIDIYDGVPILITRGYALAGVPEESRSYLKFCVENCNWRQTRFSTRSADELKEIVTEWMTQRKWHEPLQEWDRSFFLAQAAQESAQKTERTGPR